MRIWSGNPARGNLTALKGSKAYLDANVFTYALKVT